MVGLNKIIIIGNVGTDPEMRYTPNGNPVTSFRMATSRFYNTADGERRQDTEWFTVVAWNQLAEQCNQFLAKGRRAYVEGRLHSNQWEGQDGTVRFRNEIISNRVIFLDRPPESDSGSDSFSHESNEAASSSTSAAQINTSTEPDELPF